ncbi:hypothetical protein SK128_014493, partial [Halocaridina rubra]
IPLEGLTTMPHHEVLKALRIVEGALQIASLDVPLIIQQMKSLLGSMTTGQDDYMGENTSLNDVISLFSRHNGIKTLLTLLMIPDSGIRCCSMENCDHDRTVGNLHAIALSILNRLTSH